MRQVIFTVYGRPQPAGSKRSFRHPATGKIVVVDANRHAKTWKQEVASAAASALNADAMFGRGEPVLLRVIFHLMRPKGHFGTGRNAGRLRASAPAFPTVMPDATKLLRGVEDALTGVLWHDDAQVVSQHVEKRYAAGAECCEVVVSGVLFPTPAEQQQEFSHAA